MKSLGLAIAVVALALGSTFSFAASKPQSQRELSLGSMARVGTFHVPVLAHMSLRGGIQPLAASQRPTLSDITAPPRGPDDTGTSVTTQADASATATSNPTAQPTATTGPNATVTSTTTSFPDPVSILQQMFTVYGLLRSVHYELDTDAQQAGAENLHLVAKGDATCKNSAIKGRLTVTDSLVGTSQISKLDEYFIQIKKNAFVRSKTTHNKWAKGKASTLSNFGVSVDNVLLCPTTTSGGSGGSSNTQIKDLINLGPETFSGTAVWHIRATEVLVATDGTTSESTIDFLVSQDHSLPVVFSVTIHDTQQHLDLVQKQILSQFGKKVSISAPKLGSLKP